ncbi:tetratricopeptide repeat protein [Sungkyunkwania multivorans]|uniref:Tetratricopeptide repeat protein n=1 Tax=Sungkyunkwania multivorans TaxID=1173618 RepID=A0ABW3D0H8_9FLAO
MKIIRNTISSYYGMVAMVIVLIYLLGILFSECLWGVHFLAFLPIGIKLTIPLIAIASIFLSGSERLQETIQKWCKMPLLRYRNVVLVGATYGLLFYAFPIAQDYYGNARSFIPFSEQIATSFPKNFVADLFVFELDNDKTRWTFFKLVTASSYLFDITHEKAFRLLNAFFGCSFIIIWLWTVLYFVKTRIWQIILMLTGSTAPFLMVYFGHLESYGFIFLLTLIWLLTLVKIVQTKNKKLFWLLPILLLIALRFHLLMLLFVPSLLLTAFLIFSPKANWTKKVISLKGIGLGILLPAIIFGLYGYFFVFEDHIDPMILENDTPAIDRLFLPLFAPEAPLDKYTLLSWNHILDLFNTFFYWSPVLLFLIAVLFKSRKKIDWKSPTLLLLGLSFVLFMMLLIVINPLLSLPMDWDLFCFPAIIMLVILLHIFSQLRDESIAVKILPICLGLSILSLPVFIVKSSLTMHSYRMERVATHVYKTYYQHSDAYMLKALQMIPNDHALYEQRKEALLERLKPIAVEGNDKKYAYLLLDDGVNALLRNDHEKATIILEEADHYFPNDSLILKYLNEALLLRGKSTSKAIEHTRKEVEELIYLGLKASREMKDYPLAIALFDKAESLQPNNPDLPMYKMEVFFFEKDHKAAFNEARKLVKLKHPSEKQSLRFGIHCALEAAMYSEAEQYSASYLEKWPEDRLIAAVYRRLRENEEVAALKFLFSRS